MTWWNSLDRTRRTVVLLGMGVIACVVVVACTMRGPKDSGDDRTAQVPPARGEPTDKTEAPSVPDTSEEPAAKARAPKRKTPFSEEEIADARARIAGTSDYGARLEARRTLLYALARVDQLSEAVIECGAMLDDVERTEGRNMAERAALSDGNNLQSLELYAAAIAAYDRLLTRWPDSRFAAEAMFHKGGCYLDRREYVEAEQVWQGLIERHDDTTFAPWGWRKMALAQLLQDQPDRSLATLEIMASKYEGTPFGEYARMRRGYVQMVDGRMEEARKTFGEFLETCSGSKYCRLVKKQMKELDGYEALARADGRGR